MSFSNWSKYYFGVFSKKEELYLLVEKMWSVALENLLHTAESTMEKLYVVQSAQSASFASGNSPNSSNSSYNIEIPSTPRDSSPITGTPPSPVPEAASSPSPLRNSGSYTRRRNTIVEDIGKQRRKEDIRQVFRLPVEENIVIEGD